MFSMYLHVWKKLIKMTTIIKNTQKSCEKKFTKDIKRRKRQKAKKGPRKISKFD